MRFWNRLNPYTKNILRQQKIALDERLETKKQLDNQILEYLSTQSEIEKEFESAALFREPTYEDIVKIEEALSFCKFETRKAELREKLAFPLVRYFCFN